MQTKTRIAAASLVVSASTLIGVAMHEGYMGTAYKDVGGVETIGFGETKGVKAGQTTTPVRALVDLQQALDTHAKGMIACINVPISQGEYDAYLDFTYNVGVHAFCTSTLNYKLNAMDYVGACQELLKWTRAGNQILPGLVRRRQEEYEKCLAS